MLSFYCIVLISLTNGGIDQLSQPQLNQLEQCLGGLSSSIHKGRAVPIKAEISKDAIAHVNPRFLSVAMGSSIFYTPQGFNFTSAKLLTLARGLSPAYLRFGGTASGYLWFDDEGEDGDDEDDGKQALAGHKMPLMDFSEDDILSLYNFARSAGFRLLFDLNILLRNGSQWDATNPTKLLDYLIDNDMTDNLDLQLGNEPRSMQHQSEFDLPADQLGEDYIKLKNIMNSRPELQKCKLIGAEITRPWQDYRHEYLSQFLTSVNRSLDAVSWHQYYLSGKTSVLDDFLSPDTLDLLVIQVAIVKDTVMEAGYGDLPIWLTETSSANGGGKEGVSDTYAGGFTWLDKLGICARDGVEIVARQTFYKGQYALIDPFTYEPRPDYGLSLLYKRLVGDAVLSIALNDQSRYIRVYAHCTNSRSISGYAAGDVVVYALNLYNDRNIAITLPDMHYDYLDQYLLRPPNHNLTSKSILLNGRILEMEDDFTLPTLAPLRLPATQPLTLPAMNYAFFVLVGADLPVCM